MQTTPKSRKFITFEQRFAELHELNLPRQEAMMPLYKVSFFKTLLSSDGHPFKALQRAVEVRSKTTEDAVNRAQHEFARCRHIRDWWLHADAIETTANGETSQTVASDGNAAREN